MGCDIHIHYEILANGRWTLLDWQADYAIGRYVDGSRKLNHRAMWKDPLDLGRNYELFAVLAGVRNENDMVPISSPRGIPEDATSETKAEFAEQDCDAHSASWLTLREALEYNYNQTVSCSGYVSPIEFLTWLEKGKPNGWCGGVGGGGTAIISHCAMFELLKMPEAERPEFRYTNVSWTETYRSAIGERWFKTMQYLSDKFGIDNVRLVFWFDN